MSFDYSVTGGGDRFLNRPFSQILDLRDFDLDLWSGHTAYRPLPTLTDLLGRINSQESTLKLTEHHCLSAIAVLPGAWRLVSLTIWRPLLPYGYSCTASCVRPG